LMECWGRSGARRAGCAPRPGPPARRGDPDGKRPATLVPGDPGPWRRAILGRGRWDADARRDSARDPVVEPLADEDAVLVVDATGLPRREGVPRCRAGMRGFWRYTGCAGKIANRQIGVFPDRRVPGSACSRPVSRGAVMALRSWLYRSGVIPAKGVDERAGPDGGRLCAAGHRLCHPAGPGAGPAGTDRSRPWRRRAVCLDRGRRRPRRGRGREGGAARRQKPWARRRRHPPVQLPGRQAPGCRDRGRDRRRA
jgi:hypothetical protein